MCKSSNSETIFADVSRNWKMTSSINFIYGTYLWEFQVTSRSQYVTWFLFLPRNHGLQILKDYTMNHLLMLRSLMNDHFKVRMLLSKFCVLGKRFIAIPKVVLGLQKKVEQRGISCMESWQNMWEWMLGFTLAHNVIMVSLISYNCYLQYHYYYQFALCWQDVKILQLKYLHNRSYTKNSMLIKVN